MSVGSYSTRYEVLYARVVECFLKKQTVGTANSTTVPVAYSATGPVLYWSCLTVLGTGQPVPVPAVPRRNTQEK